MTDSGTVGLTGDKSYSVKTLASDEDIPAEQRLARFQAIFESGGEQSGPGLFGRGKLIFNAASKQSLVYYDSLTRDGVYRFGMRRIEGREFHQPEISEGQSAKDAFRKRFKGVLEPLAQTGTRVIVIDPIPDLVEDVRSGAFLYAIEETWWELIRKYSARKITLQIDDEQPQTAKEPVEFNGLPEKNQGGWKVYCKEHVELQLQSGPYRVKRIHFLVCPEGTSIRPDLLEVKVHRRGMAIGPIRLAVPAPLENRLFGYVTLDDKLEDLLAAQENLTHYGFSFSHKAPYKNLRQLVVDHLDRFLEELGFKKTANANRADQARF